jgi:signal peptidase II
MPCLTNGKKFKPLKQLIFYKNSKIYYFDIMLIAHFLSAILIVLDQLSKNFIIQHKDNQILRSIKIPNVFELTTSWNSGISFGIFANLEYANNLILIINGIAISQIYLFALKKVRKPAFLAYFIILAGAISNLIDRVLHCAVFDFINFCPKGNSLLIFNFSDVLIFVGIFWAIAHKLRD